MHVAKKVYDTLEQGMGREARKHISTDRMEVLLEVENPVYDDTLARAMAAAIHTEVDE